MFPLGKGTICKIQDGSAQFSQDLGTAMSDPMKSHKIAGVLFGKKR